MKRYRVCSFDFDSTAKILSTEIIEEWDEKVKEQWIMNKQRIKEYLITKYGALDYKTKCSRLQDLDAKPFSILSYHNEYLDQIRDAYIIGAYYPALTGCCSLGERILNHLVLDLRDDYPSDNSEIADVYVCKSSTNWKIMIKALKIWNVFDEQVEDLFNQLTGKRQRAIHFNAQLNLKEDSLMAINIMQNIIQKQFGGIGNPKLFIPAKGEVYIKKEMECNPFVKKFYLPNCVLVSPYHLVSMSPYRIQDPPIKNEVNISDDEFIRLREEFQRSKLVG